MSADKAVSKKRKIPRKSWVWVLTKNLRVLTTILMRSVTNVNF